MSTVEPAHVSGMFPEPGCCATRCFRNGAGYSAIHTGRSQHRPIIGIGAVRESGRSPPTPPGMRVRTGRFEQLRS
ncbi:hypothetical protein F7R21_32855 [Burkholderia latens]|uniref:Uncharacterized protein n=1 Tax=Burkholderia latens TaxID=488446 RepID=A0A6H9SJ54_9BURK|nr:hypothetical protein F7R21_32855 [Burkholderia latens]